MTTALQAALILVLTQRAIAINLTPTAKCVIPNKNISPNVIHSLYQGHYQPLNPLKQGDLVEAGNWIHVSCELGYALIHPHVDFYQCGYDGKWKVPNHGSGPVDVECKKTVPCAARTTTIPHLLYYLHSEKRFLTEGEEVEVDAQITVSCMEGFKLIYPEASLYQCGPFGWIPMYNFVDPTPMCIPQTSCILPHYDGLELYYTRNGTTEAAYESKHIASNSYVLLHCRGTSWIDGDNDKLFCQREGEWTTPIPRCQKKCTMPSDEWIPNALYHFEEDGKEEEVVMKYQPVIPPGIVYVTCREGFQLAKRNSSYIICGYGRIHLPVNKPQCVEEKHR